MNIPTDREIDNFFEFHPYLTIVILVTFGAICLKFLGFVCTTFFGG